jgi:hypothetical protein
MAKEPSSADAMTPKTRLFDSTLCHCVPRKLARARAQLKPAFADCCSQAADALVRVAAQVRDVPRNICRRQHPESRLQACECCVEAKHPVTCAATFACAQRTARGPRSP